MHSEGILAGEMKHGPLALVDERMPILGAPRGWPGEGRGRRSAAPRPPAPQQQPPTGAPAHPRPPARPACTAVIATRDAMHAKMVSVLEQLLARGVAANLLVVCCAGDEAVEALCAGRGCSLIRVPQARAAPALAAPAPAAVRGCLRTARCALQLAGRPPLHRPGACPPRRRPPLAPLHPQTADCLQPIVNIVPLQLLVRARPGGACFNACVGSAAGSSGGAAAPGWPGCPPIVGLPPCLPPIAAWCARQAYHLTVLRGFDVDQPRHLAKSVTVLES